MIYDPQKLLRFLKLLLKEKMHVYAGIKQITKNHISVGPFFGIFEKIESESKSFLQEI